MKSPCCGQSHRWGQRPQHGGRQPAARDRGHCCPVPAGLAEVTQTATSRSVTVRGQQAGPGGLTDTGPREAEPPCKARIHVKLPFLLLLSVDQAEL